MPLRHIMFALVTFVVLAVAAWPLHAAGRVRLELVGDTLGSALVFQEWVRVLGAAGVKDVRIRSGRGITKVGIEVGGTQEAPSYLVTGILKSRDELLLPGGRFRRRDVARLARWLDDLAKYGPEESREQPSAFGLTGREFEQLRREAGRPVDFSTAGVARSEVVEKIGRRLQWQLRIDPPLAGTLGEDKVGEELTGLSCGTALAYVLRPAGLCLVPGRRGTETVCTVAKARPGLEVWPVGWESEKPRRELVPALFEFHNVNVQGVSAATALQAIGRRLKILVLVDHNALARHGVDPAKVAVSHPRSRTTYSIALRKILFQAGLKSEVRVDEAGQPFLWVSTVKPV